MIYFSITYIENQLYLFTEESDLRRKDTKLES